MVSAKGDEMQQVDDAMARALDQAEKAAALGEVPVGAVLVSGQTGKVILARGNRVAGSFDPAGHAEMRVIRAACRKLQQWRLENYDLYVTLEPCAMCAGIISHSRIRRLYFGAYDSKGGGVEHGARVFDHPTCHHRPMVIGGVREAECASLLHKFFRQKRVKNPNDTTLGGDGF